MGDGKHLGFRFILKIESSKGFTDELLIACYWREKEESKMTNLSANSVVSVCKIHLEPDHFFIDFTVTIIYHPNYSNSIINGFYYLLVLLWSIFSTWSDPLKHVRA